MSRRGLSCRLTAALLLLVSSGLVFVPRSPVRPASAVPAYRNPVFARNFPDPSVLKVGADYYAYATTTGWEPLDHLFPILRSRDLVH